MLSVTLVLLSSALQVQKLRSLRGHVPKETQNQPAEEPQFRRDGDITIETDSGPVVLQTEFPQNYDKFMEGLMWRHNLCENCAMAFPWSEDQPQLSFWMEHTPLPLDIIYANAQGKVVSVKRLEPESRAGVPSDLPSDLAIEVNAGFAAAKGIGP